MQALRYRGQVILTIRGTELKHDLKTMVQNLLVDLGIGNTASNSDLKSLKRAAEPQAENGVMITLQGRKVLRVLLCL